MEKLKNGDILDCATEALKITEEFFETELKLKSQDGKHYKLVSYKFTYYPKQILTSPLYNGVFNTILRYLLRVKSQ